MNKIINNLKLNPTYVQDLTEAQIKSLFKKLDDAYYVKGKPLISDELYDQIRKIALIDENNVGIGVVDKKVKLPYWMGSLDKIINFEKFIKKYDNNGYVVSDKLDGISGMLVLDKVSKLYTRGNGEYGQDISHLLNFINIDKSIIEKKHKKRIVLRGELIIKKTDVSNFDSDSNIRNIVAGLVNRKVLNKELLKHINFVCYSVIEPAVYPKEYQKFVEKMNIQFVYNKYYSAIDLKKLHTILSSRKKKSEYDIDGIVIMSNNIYEIEPKKNPEYSFAFKSNDLLDSMDTTVELVEWNVSKDGYLKPTIILKPIKISGSTIKKTNGFNADYILKNKIVKGTRVVIQKSGDVIPNIIKIYPNDFDVDENNILPNNFEWKWNDKHKDIILTSLNSDDQQLKELEHFFTKIKVKWLSKQTLKKLFDSGYKTPYSIYKIKLKDLSKVISSEVTSKKIIDEREKTFGSVTLVDLMEASNSFGRSIGRKKLEMIISVCTNCSYDELMKINGISKTGADQFLHGYKRFEEFMKSNPFSYIS
jgi:NAD-dependent DNA ligase